MNRTAWQVLAASAASFALAALLPASPLAGVRGMLVVLPVVAALFASVARAAGGARPGPLELTLGAAWVLFATQHDALGLPGSAALVAASGLALAGVRTLLLARRLRHGIADSGLWPYFALPLALYLAAWPWATSARAPDGDEPYYLLLAHSLAKSADVDLTDDYRDRAWSAFSAVPIAPQPGDPVGANGELYSRHSAFLPLLLAPLYRLAGPFGAQLGMLALAAATAAAGLAALRVRMRERPRALAFGWALLAFSPPLLLYAGQIWVEVPAALCLALVLLALARLERRATESAAPPVSFLTLALPLVALPLLKLRFLALALPLGLVAAARLRGAVRLRPRLFVLAATTIAGLGLWNFWRYGHPLRMYRGADLALFDVPLALHLRGDLGLFFDAAYGLFALAPIWLVLLPALFLAVGDLRRGVRALPFAELAALLPYLLLVGMRREWYGGWSPPFRYAVVLLPALAIVAASAVARGPLPRPLRVVGATLATLTAALALVYLVHPAWAYSLANGASRLLDELAADWTIDLARLLPSMVRPRPATWWVPALLAAAALWAAEVARRGRRAPRAGRGTSSFGTAALLLLFGWSLWFLLAAKLPTTRIEFEDAWVTHGEGALFPERWTIDRTRFDGGWALRRNGEVRVRPVAGGDSCRLALRLWNGTAKAAPLALELRAGDRTVARLALPETPAAPDGALAWARVETEPFPLAAGESLRLRAVDGGAAPAQGFVVLDFAEVTWR